jgi:SAM-dependent methyltransferase
MEKKEIQVTGFETMASSMEFVDNYNHWILGKFAPFKGKRILEIGTGQGNFRKILEPGSDCYVSIDIDEDVIRRAQERDPGGNYLQADAAGASFEEKLSQFGFDTVICINVLEHIPDDQAALDNMLKVLKPGGHLLIFSPAFMHLYNDLDKLAGHVIRYKKGRLKKMAHHSGLGKIIVNEYFNPVGALGWWLNKFVTHKNINSGNVNSQVMFFDKYVVPVSRLMNPLFKNIWGQSVYCVIQKV